MELADQQNAENEGVQGGADIPSGEPQGGSEAVSDKPLSLRQTLEKSVESVRTEEAKRARAADGKFTKLDASAEKPAAAEIPEPKPNAQPEASPAEGPPSAWKSIWESLTPEARAIAVKRESEVAKGFDEYRGKTAQLQEITQALDPIRPILQQSGIQSDAQAVKTLLQWEAGFRNPQTRMQAFQHLASQYGVDLSTLAQTSTPSPSSVQDIPEPLRPVIDQFGNIVQQVQNINSRVQNWEQSQISEKLAAFAKDKPHFDAVRTLMGQLMTAGAATDLESAYQQATKIHPEVSAKIEAERVAKETAERERTQAEKAAKARLAAVSPGPRSPTGAPGNAAQKGNKGVRESLLSSISELREGQRA